MRRALLMLALTLLELSAVTRNAAADQPAEALMFRRLLVNTGGEHTEACFRFDHKLDTSSSVEYVDHLRITHLPRPAVRIENQDLCVGNLEFGVRYQATLLAGLKALNGSRLAKDVVLGVSLGDRPASVAVMGDGYIMPRTTSHGLTIATVNVPRVRIHVFRVSTDTSLTTLTDDANDIDLNETNIRSYSLDNLLKTKLVPVWHGDMDVAQQSNRTVETAFPLPGIVGTEKPGLFLVIAENSAKAVSEKVFDPDASSAAAGDGSGFDSLPAHWIDVTNTGLTTFSGADGLHVFARALDTASPLAGIHLVLRAHGGDILADATTGSDGAVAFPAGAVRGKAAEAPATLTAIGTATGTTNDFTMLRLDNAAFDFSDRGAEGMREPGPAQAFLATDRGIYRPGETVHVTALLRDTTGLAIAGQRLTLVLRRPDGVEARRTTVAAASDGGWALTEDLTATAAFGTWSVEALTDQTAAPVGTVSFSVQDFVPQLLAVNVHAATPTLRAGEAAHATLTGRFLYGAPAAGLTGQVEVRFASDDNPAPGFSGYSWGLAGEQVSVDPIEGKVKADSAGLAAIDFTPDPPSNLTSPLRATLTAGLFEPGGRIVQDATTLPVFGAKPLIGIKPAAVVGSDDQMTVPVAIASVSADRKPLAIKRLHWSVIRENRIYDWFENGGDWSFHYHVIDEPILNGDVATGSDGRANLAPRLDWGNYRVVVADEDSGAESSARFDVGWNSADTGPDSPDRLPVTVRDKTVAPEASTVIHVTAPFAGHALLTIAGSRIFETRELDIPKAGLDITVTAHAEWGAGAYALVTLYRPLNVASRPHDPVRAVGLAWIGLNQSAHTLSVTLDAPAQITPRRTLMIPVTVRGGRPGETVRMTLAGVDEGILQLTRYRLPDPLEALFGKRALGVDMRDDYGRLLEGNAQVGTIHAGGDEGEGGAGLAVISSKIVSRFTGPVALDANGHGILRLTVPDFEGQLRLMALAWSPSAVGSTSTDMTVRDPVFADVALPRFLAPGDTAAIAISVANTDAPVDRFHVALAASGAVRLDGAASFDPTLAKGARAQFAANLVGTADGIGTVTASLTRPGDPAPMLKRSWHIVVRAPHFPQISTTTAQQKPGDTFTPDPKTLAGFVPGTASLTIGYEGFAGIDTVGLLQSLGDDDWDCSEQLASSSWPLLYFNDPALLGRLPRPAGVHARIQHAIDAIIDHEDAAGRFGLWRVGDGAATPWLDVYLVDFLLHARDAGFTVPPSSLNRALDWLDEEQVQGFGDFDRFQETVHETRAYALFVLARAGRASPEAIRRMHDDLYSQRSAGNPYQLVFWSSGTDAQALAQPSSLAHLGAALALTGDAGGAANAFDMAADNLGDVRVGRQTWFDFTYWSYVRDLASVTALAAEGGDDRLAQSLVGRFNLLTLTPPLLNTQEKAALLGAAHALDRDEPGRQLSLDGTPTAKKLHLPAAFSPDARRLSQAYVLANTGTVPLWRTVTIVGVPTGVVGASAHGFSIDRSTLDLGGHPVDVAHLHQNDRILVVLHGTASDDDDHRAVLVDMLPAGLEIETPVRSPKDYAFLGPLTRSRSIEARDDRLVAAFDLGQDLDPPQYNEVDDDNDSDSKNDNDNTPAALEANEFRMAYVARVVTPGHFTVPEAMVQDMYRPSLAAHTASAVTDISTAK